MRPIWINNGHYEQFNLFLSVYVYILAVVGFFFPIISSDTVSQEGIHLFLNTKS